MAATKELPATIGRYRIDGILGAGAMGTVYAAFDPGIGRRVVIKTINRELFEDDSTDEWLERFRVEARAAGRCQHPNIVTLFEFAQDNDLPFLAMELVEGRSLDKVLREQPQLTIRFGGAIALQVLDALAYAHGQGIIHRDIKPSNILLIEDGRAKVTDFGIARLDLSDLTRAGEILGTFGYMSPEQLAGQTIDARADLFAVAVMLYQMLAGRLPFRSRNLHDLLWELREQRPADLRSHNSEVSACLSDVVARGMAVSPDIRYPTAAAFRDALRPLILTGPASESGDDQAAADETMAISRVSLAKQAAVPVTPAGIDPDDLRQAERELATFVGPAARVLIGRAVGEAASLPELGQSLARHIGDHAERARFMERIIGLGTSKINARATNTGNGTSRGTTRIGLDDPGLEEIARLLTAFVGPAARLLVRTAAAGRRSRTELYQTLADHIPNPRERGEFLAQCWRLPP